jgi:hypothetical protein
VAVGDQILLVRMYGFGDRRWLSGVVGAVHRLDGLVDHLPPRQDVNAVSVLEVVSRADRLGPVAAFTIGAS